MHKIICLFNHKGGVSKTTTTFNLGWMMARLGKRVLLADFDPQCNLTGMVMGFSGLDDLEATYKDLPPNNVKDGLTPAFESQPREIVGADCEAVRGNPNLFLLRGHIALSEYETTLGIAQELSGSLLPLRNLPGSIRFLLDKTAQKYEVDYVLVDMSPSLGPMNQNLLTTSDFFIVPLHPDYFSSMALTSLARSLPRWQAWAKSAASIDALTSANYPFPVPHAKFIGAVVQKYRPRNGGASKAFQKWIDQLSNGLKDTLIPALKRAELFSDPKFLEKAGVNPWQPILDVPDFNSVIAMSQEHNVPVYELTQLQTEQSGAVWQLTQINMRNFETAFRTCAERVIALTN
jgi:cellulose biosynthesis protein BcsQ